MSLLREIGYASAAILKTLVGPMLGKDELIDSVGYVVSNGPPTSVVPDFIGQHLYDSSTPTWYKAHGVAAGQWTLSGVPSNVVLAQTDPVTGGITGYTANGQSVLHPAIVPNSLFLIGDSLTAINYKAFIVTGVTISGGVMTITTSSESYPYAGRRFALANVTDSAGKDLNGNYVTLSRTSSTISTCSAPSGAADGACTLGIAPTVYNLQFLCDTGPITWLNILSKQKFEIVGNSFGHGWTSSYILSKVPDALASESQYVSVLAGTNDLSAIAAQGDIATVVSSVTTNLAEIYGQLTGAGRKVIAFTIPPAGSSVTNYALKNVAAVEINKYIRSASRLTNGIILIDAYAAVVDPINATAGIPATNMLQSDDIHWTAKGAFAVGTAGNTATSSIPLIDDRVSSNADNYGNNAASTNLFDSAPWVNTGGTVSAPVTGVTPTGFTVSQTGSITVSAGTAPARSDGYGYNVKLAATGVANNDVSQILASTGVPAARLTAGENYRTDASVAITGMSGSAITQYVLSNYATIDGNANNFAAGLFGSNTAQPTTDWSGVVRTPFWKFTGTMGSLVRIYSQIYFSGAGSSISQEVGRISVRKNY